MALPTRVGNGWQALGMGERDLTRPCSDIGGQEQSKTGLDHLAKEISSVSRHPDRDLQTMAGPHNR